jgi:hypothetical protein
MTQTNTTHDLLVKRAGTDGLVKLAELGPGRDDSLIGTSADVTSTKKYFVDKFTSEKENGPRFLLKEYDPASKKSEIVTGLFNNKSKAGKEYLGGKDRDGNHFMVFKKDIKGGGKK